jgi:hypothetical protein
MKRTFKTLAVGFVWLAFTLAAICAAQFVIIGFGFMTRCIVKSFQYGYSL